MYVNTRHAFPITSTVFFPSLIPFTPGVLVIGGLNSCHLFLGLFTTFLIVRAVTGTLLSVGVRRHPKLLGDVPEH